MLTKCWDLGLWPGAKLARFQLREVFLIAMLSHRFISLVIPQGFPSGLPEALTNPGTNPWALAVLLWLGLVNTALVLFLETDALESVSASGKHRGQRLY